MAEDRGIEPVDQLLKLCEQPDTFARFIKKLCHRADEKYNSGLFHFKKEAGVTENPDQITPKLIIDDKIFKPILQSLYFEHGSPYHFGVLPVEILGTVYERFLGKVIRLTSGHQAKIEEKPEVRKAGGVYYTPSYIVDYIVKHTVQKQIEGRSADQLLGKKGNPPFRVLDMSCGSGSFLLGAYQCLLEHYLKWYTDHRPEANKKSVFKDARSGQYRLTIETKKRILTTHIFGVDIDSQAVEVSKLSLLLKVLESETGQSLGQQLQFFQDKSLQRVLPNLADNIKCGNSLITPSYFTGKLSVEPEAMKRINPFDWKKGFPDVMTVGGFDCIIGNPPYIRIQTMKEWAPQEVEIYKELFEAGKSGNYDVYVVFIEQGLRLLNHRGKLGFICPHKFFNSKYGEKIRLLVSENKHLSHIVHFGAQQVFEGATTYTCLLFLNKQPSSEFLFAKVDDLLTWRTGGKSTEGRIRTDKLSFKDWHFPVGQGADLFTKLSEMPHKLGDVADIFVGLQTSADDVYIMDFIMETEQIIKLKSKSLNSEFTFEKNLLFPVVSGTDVCRYSPLQNRQYILFPYIIQNKKPILIDFKTIQQNLPKTADYFLKNKHRLENRENSRIKGPNWHGYIYLKNMARQSLIKLCVPRLVDQLHASLDHDGSHFLDNVDVGGVIFNSTYEDQRLEYLLALINSRLIRWFFPQVSAPFRGGWLSANRQFLSLIPFRIIDFQDLTDNTIHNQIITLVNSMVSLHNQIYTLTSEAHREIIQRQIDATDLEIDRLIYSLYKLTPEEIAIVEKGSYWKNAANLIY